MKTHFCGGKIECSDEQGKNSKIFPQFQYQARLLFIIFFSSAYFFSYPELGHLGPTLSWNLLFPPANTPTYVTSVCHSSIVWTWQLLFKEFLGMKSVPHSPYLGQTGLCGG